MLRNLLKLITKPDPVAPSEAADASAKPTESTAPAEVVSDSDAPMIAGKIGAGGIVETFDTSVADASVPPANHRAWLLSKQLSHIKLCSPARCEKLAKYGVVTAGDLAKIDAVHLVAKMQIPETAIRSLQRYSAAIRLAASVPGMMPRDAQLLIRIHRHSIRSIALDSPSALYQDLQRFAHSTTGRRIVGTRRLPSLRKVKSWVQTCRDHNESDRNDGEQTIRAAA